MSRFGLSSVPRKRRDALVTIAPIVVLIVFCTVGRVFCCCGRLHPSGSCC